MRCGIILTVALCYVVSAYAEVGGTFTMTTTFLYNIESPSSPYCYLWDSGILGVYGFGGCWQTNLIDIEDHPMPRKIIPVTNIQHTDANAYYQCWTGQGAVKVYDNFGQWQWIKQTNSGRTGDDGTLITGIGEGDPQSFMINCDWHTSGNGCGGVTSPRLLGGPSPSPYWYSFVTADLIFRQIHQRSDDPLALSLVFPSWEGGSLAEASNGGPACNGSAATSAIALAMSDDTAISNNPPITQPPYSYPINGAKGWSQWSPTGYASRNHWYVDYIDANTSLSDTAPYCYIGDANLIGTQKVASYDTSRNLIDWLPLNFYQVDANTSISDYVILIDPCSIAYRGLQTDAYDDIYQVLLVTEGGNLVIEPLPAGWQDARFNLVDYAIIANLTGDDFDLNAFCETYLQLR